MSSTDNGNESKPSLGEKIRTCEHRLARMPPDGNRDLIERAWAAGFFDGEGHVSASKRSGEFDCSVEQIEDDLINLVRLQRAVGVGRITSLAPRKHGKGRPLCRWYVSNQHDLGVVFSRIGPFINEAKKNGRPKPPTNAIDPPMDGFARALTVPLKKYLNRDLPLPPGTLSHEASRRRIRKKK